MQSILMKNICDLPEGIVSFKQELKFLLKHLLYNYS